MTETKQFRQILRELPRRQLVLLLVVLAVSVPARLFAGGFEVGAARNAKIEAINAETVASVKKQWSSTFLWPKGPDFVPPWEWTEPEWRGVVWWLK